MADKKIWVVSKAVFPMEDPTNVGTSEKITRIEGLASQLVPLTPWVNSQLRAGSLVAYDGNPEEGGKPLPAPEAAAPAAPAEPPAEPPAAPAAPAEPPAAPAAPAAPAGAAGAADTKTAKK